MSKTTNKTSSKRPPVVVVLGHVDHGKTSLLDTIRKTNVAEGESGGITQHIGAYQVEVPHDNEKRLLTFVDTPGHAAFHQMRSRGATVADIAILIVAADDGVQPQTKEAVDHIREADIPFVVAINKIDKDNANTVQTRAGLAEIDVSLEVFGGDIPDVEISAINGDGVSNLLELVILTADLQNLEADSSQQAEGVIIEAELDQKRGPLATLLVHNGTLKLGDTLATATTKGTARALEDHHGSTLEEASPSAPVRVLGLSDVPIVGELFNVVANEKEIDIFQQAQTTKLHERRRVAETAAELPVILKADSKGTLEALAEMLEDIGTQDHAVSVIHRAVGEVSDGDVKTAEAAGGIIVAFRVSIDSLAERRAKERDVSIIHHDVIYEIVERAKKQLESALDTKTENLEFGRLKVLAVFKDEKKRGIIGGRVISGSMKKRVRFEIHREEEIVGTGTVLTLQLNKKDVAEISKGDECGLRTETTERIREGDILIAHHEVKSSVSLDSEDKENSSNERAST